MRIKCAECPDFDLCLDCFAVGVEITPHKSGHAYRVVDNLSFPLYHPDWGVSTCLCMTGIHSQTEQACLTGWWASSL